MSILYIEDNKSNAVIMYKHLIYLLHHSNEHWKEYVLHCKNIE